MGQQTSTTTRLSDFDPAQARITGADGGTPIATEVIYGQSDHGTDLKVWGDTAANYMLWDESVDSLLLIGTAAKFRLGTFGSSAAGSGVALDATNSAAFRAYADDGGAAIGSGTLARVGEFRHLLTYTSGNREQEAAGVVGKLVSVAGTNRHNMCGVMGSYETKTSLTVGGQAATTDTWCQAAIIGRVGGASITIDTNVLAGVAAMSNVATALAANNGIYPAFYAGKWASTETWTHGLYVQHIAVDKAFQVGELSSTSQTGFHLTSTNNNVIDSFADDNNTTLGDAVYSNIRARTMLFKACTAGTIVSVKGQLKFADEADMGPGVFAGVQGYMELYTDLNVKSGGKFWGVDSSIEAPTSGTLTVDSGGIAAGLHAELTGSGTATQASGGVLAGLYIDEQITSGDWGYAVYVASGDRAWYSTTTLTGSAALNVMHLAVTDQIAIASTSYTRGLYINYTNAGTKSANAEVNGIGVDMNATSDVTSLYCVSLYTGAMTGATVNRVAGIYTYIDDVAGTVGATSCMHLETASDGATSRDDFISIRAHVAGVHAVISDMSGGATATNLLEFGGVNAPVEAFNAAGNGAYSIKCRINGVTTYLHTYDAP